MYIISKHKRPARFVHLGLLLILLATLVGSATAAPADLDTGFDPVGNDGIVTTDFNASNDRGKSVALQSDGARVGVLDADIYGPSMPRMLGVRGQPRTDGNRIVPQEAHGLQVMSIGFMVEEDTPMIWRGPMVTSALQQLLTETNWQSLDYLVIDLPPGTGDIQLTLAQRIPVAGCLIVTTPQDIALLDARKAIQMFRKVEMSVLGIVENMSTHICSQCGHEEPIFGSGGGARMSAQYDVPLLGQLPLDLHIREALDEGRPTVAAAPDSELSQRYLDVARRVAAHLSMTPRSLAVSLPQINVLNT